MKLRRKRGLASGISFWTTLIIAACSLLMVILGAAVNIRNQAIGEAIEEQFQGQVRVQELDQVSRTIISSYRGYIAYGRIEFLDHMFSDIEGLLIGLEQLQSAMESSGFDGRRQADEVSYIRSMWRDVERNMERGVEYKQHEDKAALDILSQTQITPSIESINKRFTDLLKLQESRVQDLVGQNKDMSYRLLLVPMGIILLTGLMGYYLVSYLRRTVVAPVTYMSTAVSRIASGDYAEVESSDRPDELGDLQRGILVMTQELRKRESELEAKNRELISQRDLLEAQNEEISAQQEEQYEMLQKLTARESELEIISSFQEKLAGYMDLEGFLDATIPVLLQVTGADGAVVVLSDEGGDASSGHVVYTAGYPAVHWSTGMVDLFGPALRVFAEKRSAARLRGLSGDERGVLPFYDKALDLYLPLLNNDQLVYGFLLLTVYGSDSLGEQALRPNKGVITQFSQALQAQVLNADRLKQADLLERLNDELLNEKLLIQDQRDLIRQINESVHEGMLMLDPEGQVVFANQKMRSYFGFLPEEHHSFNNFFEQLAKAGCREADHLHLKVKGMLEGAPERIHERFMLDGHEGSKHYELYVNPVESLSVAAVGFLLVFRDRTEEEKADEMKNEFVSIVSHELRTPLSSVLGFIEILLHRTVAPDKQKKYLETIHKEAGRLSNLINDFLDLQRMEAGKQVYQPVPLEIRGLVRQVADQWEGKNGHTVHIRFQEDELVALADQDRIMQVLHNLISNAVKYSPGADRVDVAGSLEEGMVRIDVRDYGLGIPEDAKEKLFTKFFRVDNSDRRQIGGTGLGLAIVKEIAEAHGGRLSFESEMGRGSVFTVRLPAYRPKDLTGRVVIVEDDDNLAKMIAVSFDKLNVPTVCISSSEDAVFSLERSAGSPLLCIVDIQLQGVRSGWDFMSELLRHPKHKDTPVIVSTVLEQPNHFYETSKEKYLKKPFSIGRLLELAQHLITAREAAPVLFPVQDEHVIAESFQHSGLLIKELKVQQDFIEVDVDKDGKADS